MMLDSSDPPSDEIENCCNCHASNDKCLTPSCACYVANVFCRKTCETVKNVSDCLNRPVVTCNCTNKNDDGDLVPEKNMAASISSLDKTLKGEKVKWKKSQQKNLSTREIDGMKICKNSSCSCHKFKEMCSEECKCRGECANNQAVKFLSIQEQRPLVACKCKGGRKACRKDEKCPCRKLMGYCSKSCKCKMDCNNEGKTAGRLVKSAKLCLIQPDQMVSLASVRLASETYDYQFNVVSDDCGEKHVEQMVYEKLMSVLSHYTMPLKRISIFLSKSPCYHQYCKPECDIIDECLNNRSCASTLAVMARQIRRRLRDNAIEICIKFLMPDTSRGDLYTSRSVATMLEAGINVEPISMREWSQFVFDLQLKTDGEAEDVLMAQAQSTWLACQIDQYVRHTQAYINCGREALGMRKSYWTGRLHELFKMAVKTAHESRESFDILCTHMEKMTKRRFKSDLSLGCGNTTVCSRVGAVSPVSIDKSPIFDKTYKKRSNTGPIVLTKQLAIFRSDEIHEEPPNVSCASSQAPQQKPDAAVDRKSLTLSMQNLHKINHQIAQHKGSQQEINRLVLAVSSRNITEEEKSDIKADMEEYVEDIRVRLNKFIDFLETKITSTLL